MAAKTVDSVLATKGREVTTVFPWSTVREATERMSGPPRIGALVVLGDGRRPAGLLTERDIVRGVQQHGAEASEMQVDSLMSHAIPTCRPDEALPDVMRTMTEWRFRHLPVVRSGEVVGLISIGDVVRALLQDARLEAAVLRDVVIARS